VKKRIEGLSAAGRERVEEVEWMRGLAVPMGVEVGYGRAVGEIEAGR